MNIQYEIEKLIAAYGSNENPIVRFRVHKLKAMHEYYTMNGFPQSCSLQELSLLPAYFQEANYDGINWFDQNAPLKHLESELELDCIFHNNGKTRKQLTPKEFQDYINICDAAIDRTQSKRKRTFFSRFFAKIGLPRKKQI
jgi:hypothetical protein